MSLYNKIIDLQKLNVAWEHVRRNKPAAGADHITCEQFQENKAEELKQLQIELREHRYETVPVRNVVLYKEEKERTVALYSMRDKVVQQSIARELNRLYENRLSRQTFAYRNKRSALDAVEEINQTIIKGNYGWILRTDISHFFDHIQWEQLHDILKQTISEEDVMDLIKKNAQTKMLDDSGEIQEKFSGIHQGSGISPVLSNIYLMKFDLWMETQPVYFVRYSDDILVLGSSHEELLALFQEMQNRLDRYGLEFNKEKTICGSMEAGVDFLGYHFNKTGKSIPAKAEAHLANRLETVWLTSSGMSTEDKLKKVIEIIGGWKQYFTEQKEIKSIFEYAALIYAAESRSEYLEQLLNQRKQVINIYKDIAVYLSGVWQKHGEAEMELLEYEQFYQIWNSEEEMQTKNLKLLLRYYRKLFADEDEDTMVELMQAYTDRFEYQKASYWMQKKEQMEHTHKQKNPDMMPAQLNDQPLKYDKTTAARLMNSFAGREDIYSIETLLAGSKRQPDTQLIPLTEQEIYKHLQGTVTVDTYVQRPNGTVRYIVADIDVSKKILLSNERGSDVYHSYLNKARKTAEELLKIYRTFGFTGYLEYSGCRGYHVWLLFSEWIPVRYANMLCDVLEQKLSLQDDGINIEFFPNKTRIKPGKYGQAIKIPCGFHVYTGELSYFIDEDGRKESDLNAFLDNLARFSLQSVKKVLAAHLEIKEPSAEKTVDKNLDAFSEASGSVLEILQKCSLMCYLCQKASKTGYLTHYERLSVLYVFGHLGEDGQQFVHQVMSMTLNYKYNTTEKFIQRIPEKPVSCVRLRNQYKQITAEYGCSCTFKRTKNCYPSPVLHAIALSNHVETGITIPTSRTISRANEQEFLNELNIHKKAQELAEKILGLRKQKRNLDLSIGKLERELEKLYEAADTDCIEIEMGMLVRKKSGKNVEWVIEI